MFIEIIGVCAIRNFSESLVSTSKGPIKCISLNNHPCNAIPTLFTINSDKTLFYPFTVRVNEGGGSCNTINDLYAQACIPNKIKNTNVKVFNLMAGVNETRYLVQHESCETKCGLNKVYAIQSKNGIMMNVGVLVHL